MYPTRGFAEAMAPDIPRDHPPPWRQPGLLEGPIRKGAAITGAAVVAGFVCATNVVPGAPTPDHVAAAYTQARFEQNWPAAWALVCESTRSRTTFHDFAEGVARMNEYYVLPRDVDVETGTPELTPYKGTTYVTVTVAVTSDERSDQWRFRGELPLLVDDGEFRICLPDDGPLEP